MVTNILLILILVLNAFTAITLLGIFQELNIIITIITRAYIESNGEMIDNKTSSSVMHTAN